MIVIFAYFGNQICIRKVFHIHTTYFVLKIEIFLHKLNTLSCIRNQKYYVLTTYSMTDDMLNDFFQRSSLGLQLCNDEPRKNLPNDGGDPQMFIRM